MVARPSKAEGRGLQRGKQNGPHASSSSKRETGDQTRGTRIVSHHRNLGHHRRSKSCSKNRPPVVLARAAVGGQSPWAFGGKPGRDVGAAAHGRGDLLHESLVAAEGRRVEEVHEVPRVQDDALGCGGGRGRGGDAASLWLSSPSPSGWFWMWGRSASGRGCDPVCGNKRASGNPVCGDCCSQTTDPPSPPPSLHKAARKGLAVH